jgi:hypothetical protein
MSGIRRCELPPSSPVEQGLLPFPEADPQVEPVVVPVLTPVLAVPPPSSNHPPEVIVDTPAVIVDTPAVIGRILIPSSTQSDQDAAGHTLPLSITVWMRLLPVLRGFRDAVDPPTGTA